jgi:hypothetical protein
LHPKTVTAARQALQPCLLAEEDDIGLFLLNDLRQKL